MYRLAVALLFLASALPATRSQVVLDSAQTRSAVTQAALDYAEGYYEGNGDRMERAVHPLLFKRGLLPLAPQSEPVLMFMNSEMLVEAARSGRGKLDPDKRTISCTVLDVNENTASAKIFTAQFNDYLHLARVNGQWRIVNVLWCPPGTPTGSDAPARDAVIRVFVELREAVTASDAAKAQRVLSPEVARRAFAPMLPGGRMVVQDINSEALLQLIRAGRLVPPKDQPAPDIAVLDVYENIASVKATRANGVDYYHLARQQGTWRIVNILSTMTGKPATPPAK